MIKLDLLARYLEFFSTALQYGLAQLLELPITVRNLRRVIGMTNNATVIVKNDYLLEAP